MRQMMRANFFLIVSLCLLAGGCSGDSANEQQQDQQDSGRPTDAGARDVHDAPDGSDSGGEGTDASDASDTSDVSDTSDTSDASDAGDVEADDGGDVDARQDVGPVECVRGEALYQGQCYADRDACSQSECSGDEVCNFAMQSCVEPVNCTWCNSPDVATAGNTGLYVELALDSQMTPHLVYKDQTNTAVKYATWDETNAQWVSEVVAADTFTESVSIVIDDQDQPHVAYVSQGMFAKAYYASRGSNGWQSEPFDSNTAYDGFDPTSVVLKLDSQQHPHAIIAFEEQYGIETRLKYARWDGSSWQLETLDDHVVTHHQQKWTGAIDMVIDAQDRPHLVASLLSGHLWYVKWDGDAWSQERIDDHFFDDHSPSIVLDRQQSPHVMYFEADSYGDHTLKYAYPQSQQWHIVEIAYGWGGSQFEGDILLDYRDVPYSVYRHSYYDSRIGADFTGVVVASREGGAVQVQNQNISQGNLWPSAAYDERVGFVYSSYEPDTDDLRIEVFAGF